MNLIAQIGQNSQNKIIGRIGGNIPLCLLDDTEIIGQNSQNKIIGRIGGNIPLCLLDDTEIKGYKFYTTFQNLII